MIKIENDCVGCPQGCINCGAKHVKHLYCDECSDEVEYLYKVDGEELCEECLLDSFEKVELEEY